MAQSNSKLILAGLLADGAGGESIADQAILVTDDRIAAVGTAAGDPAAGTAGCRADRLESCLCDSRSN